jgi:hypothetical protein
MKLKEKSTEKLEGELKATKLTAGTLIGMLFTLFIICIYGLATKEENGTFMVLITTPFALSPVVLLNLSNIRKIKSELESRK